MFRDLKEYQEIAKIYAEKVSKPEDLDERVRGGGVSSNPVKPFEKPAPQVSGRRDNRPDMKGGIDIKIQKPMGGAQGRTKRPTPKPSNTDASGKVIPTTAEIRAKAGNKVGGGNAGASTDSGGTSMSTIKSVPVEKEKPEVKKPEISTMTKQGKPRTKAQMMAAKRIGSGTPKNPDTTIAQVKKSNEDSMRARAKERFAAFKAKRAEKKAAMIAKEELTPYDYVLEYLLSSEQAATIEEANYVMTEMDAETIQGIVEEQKKNLEENLPLLAKGAAIVGGAVLAKKGLDKAKKSFDNFLNKQRNQSQFGGNKRVDDTRQGSGDKKVGEKIYYGK